MGCGCAMVAGPGARDLDEPPITSDGPSHGARTAMSTAAMHAAGTQDPGRHGPFLATDVS